MAIDGALLLDRFLQSDWETDSDASELDGESCAAHNIEIR